MEMVYALKPCLLTNPVILYKSSCLQSGSVAQSVEQWPFKPLVPGSSPGRPTTFVFLIFLKKISWVSIIKIQDTDVAKESTQFASNQVRMQASIAILAQAKDLNVGIRDLIRGITIGQS
jgi:hypothetical protein